MDIAFTVWFIAALMLAYGLLSLVPVLLSQPRRPPPAPPRSTNAMAAHPLLLNIRVQGPVSM